MSTWVYSRLTDSSENTYPRSLTILLSEAKKAELQQPQGKLAPNDHLLGWNSLTKGLEAASVERCDAMMDLTSEKWDRRNKSNVSSILI